MVTKPSIIRPLVFALSIIAPAAAYCDAPVPADNQIKAVYADLDRAESEARGLTPNRTANISRLGRNLDTMEQRLNSSPNKSDPSWIDASNRLQALRQALSDLSGGSAATATASAQPAATANPALDAFTSKVTGLETDAGAMAAGDVDTANALIGRLNDLVAEYKTASRSGGTGWADAAKRLNALGPQISAKARETAAPGSSQAASGAAASTAVALNSHQKVQLDRIGGNIEALAMDLDKLTPVALQDAEALNRWQSRVQRQSEDLARFDEFRALPEYSAPAARLQQAKQRLSSLEAEAKAQVGELGDVTGRFQAIEARYTGHGVLPEPLREPLDRDSVDAWSRALLAFRLQQKEDAAWLESVTGRTSLLPKNDFERVKRWVVQDVPGRVDQAVSETFQGLNGRIAGTLNTIEAMAKVSPDDQHRIRNLYLNTDVYAQRLRDMDEIDSLLDLSLQLDQSLGLDSAAHQADKARLADYRQRITNTSEAALKDARMPAANSEDSELRAIAEQTLKDPKYGVGRWTRLVITSPKRHQKEKRVEAEGSSLVIYEREWDEFQVATAEAEGDKVFIWYNTLKFFQQGYRTTPTNKWVLSERFKGGRILPENIGK